MSFCMALGPDDALCLTASRFYAKHKLPAPVEKLLTTSKASVIHTVAFGPDGAYLATYTSPDGKPHLISYALPAALIKWLAPEGQVTRDIRTLRVALGYDEAFFAFDKTQSCRQNLPRKLVHFLEKSCLIGKDQWQIGHRPRCVALGPKDTFVFIPETGRGAWDTGRKSGGLYAMLNAQDKHYDLLVALSPDTPGRYLTFCTRTNSCTADSAFMATEAFKNFASHARNQEPGLSRTQNDRQEFQSQRIASLEHQVHQLQEELEVAQRVHSLTTLPPRYHEPTASAAAQQAEEARLQRVQSAPAQCQVPVQRKPIPQQISPSPPIQPQTQHIRPICEQSYPVSATSVIPPHDQPAPIQPTQAAPTHHQLIQPATVHSQSVHNQQVHSLGYNQTYVSDSAPIQHSVQNDAQPLQTQSGQADPTYKQSAHAVPAYNHPVQTQPLYIQPIYSQAACNIPAIPQQTTFHPLPMSPPPTPIASSSSPPIPYAMPSGAQTITSTNASGDPLTPPSPAAAASPAKPEKRRSSWGKKMLKSAALGVTKGAAEMLVRVAISDTAGDWVNGALNSSGGGGGGGGGGSNIFPQAVTVDPGSVVSFDTPDCSSVFTTN